MVAHLIRGKASGTDQIPAEFWEALLADPRALKTLLTLCNACLASGSVPCAWKGSSVMMLFKKGDTYLPSNYRPISLLAVGYKVLASLILSRLKDAGTEQRLSNAQYGFRPHRGTADALFVNRRIIEATVDDKDAELYMIGARHSTALSIAPSLRHCDGLVSRAQC